MGTIVPSYISKNGWENARVVGAFAEQWITAGETVSGVHSPWSVYIVQGWLFPLLGLNCAGVETGWFPTQGGRPTEVVHGGVEFTHQLLST